MVIKWDWWLQRFRVKDILFDAYDDVASFPIVGKVDTLYLAIDTGHLYRWDGTSMMYIEVSSMVPVIDNLVSTSTTAALSANQGRVLDEKKINKSLRTIYVSSSGGDFSCIQDAIDSIIDSTPYQIILDNEVCSGNLVVPSDRNIVFSGAYKGSTIDGSITWNNTTATENRLTFENVYFQNGIFTITATNAAFLTSVWIKGGTILGSFDINFSGQINNGRHILHLVGITQSAGDVTVDFGFLDVQSSQLAGITTVTNGSIGQILGGEIGNTVNITNNSQLYPRVSATILQTIDFNCDATSFVELDGQTNSTANLIGNLTDFRIIDGSYAGVISDKPVITDLGGGIIDIGAGQCFLYNNIQQYGKPRRYDVAAAPGITLTDQKNNYIMIDWNSGSPQYFVNTTNGTNNSTIVHVAVIYRDGNILHLTDWDALGEGLPEKGHQRTVETERFAIASGVQMSMTALVLDVSAGRIFMGYVPIDANAYASDDIGAAFEFWYHTAGVWTFTDADTMNNTQYDNGTDLATSLPNRYLVRFMYRSPEPDGEVFYVDSGADYGTLVAADTATTQPPDDLPDKIKEHGLLLGKIIVEYDTANTTIYPFQKFGFLPSTVTEHNNLALINGDTPYYHLGLPDYDALTDTNAQLAELHTDGSPSFNNITAAGEVLTATLFRALTEGTQAANYVMETYSDTGSTSGRMTFRKYNGSMLLPTAVTVNATIGRFGYSVYDGTTLPQNMRIEVFASENQSPTNRGVYLKIDAIKTGAAVRNNWLEIRDGELKMPDVYNAIVGGTNRDLYIDDTGKVGYVSSALKYKKNIVGFSQEDIDKIFQIEINRFDYKDESKGTNQIGSVADNFVNLFPELVTYKYQYSEEIDTDENGDEIIIKTPILDENGNHIKEIEGINYSKFGILAIAAIENLNDRLKALEV
jgi:hypothetical protein